MAREIHPLRAREEATTHEAGVRGQGREGGGREEEEEKRGEGRGKEKATVYRYGVVSSVITLEAATALK